MLMGLRGLGSRWVLHAALRCRTVGGRSQQASLPGNLGRSLPLTWRGNQPTCIGCCSAAPPRSAAAPSPPPPAAAPPSSGSSRSMHRCSASSAASTPANCCLRCSNSASSAALCCCRSEISRSVAAWSASVAERAGICGGARGERQTHGTDARQTQRHRSCCARLHDLPPDRLVLLLVRQLHPRLGQLPLAVLDVPLRLRMRTPDTLRAVFLVRSTEPCAPAGWMPAAAPGARRTARARPGTRRPRPPAWPRAPSRRTGRPAAPRGHAPLPRGCRRAPGPGRTACTWGEQGGGGGVVSAKARPLWTRSKCVDLSPLDQLFEGGQRVGGRGDGLRQVALPDDSLLIQSGRHAREVVS